MKSEPRREPPANGKTAQSNLDKRENPPKKIFQTSGRIYPKRIFQTSGRIYPEKKIFQTSGRIHPKRYSRQARESDRKTHSS